MVFYGMDKMDEISVSSSTKICEINNGFYNTYEITPEQFGLDRCEKSDLVGGTPQENADILVSILKGEKGAKRNAVVLNAGLALYIAGKADTKEAGVALAQDLIDSGKAYETLQKYIEVSNA